MIEFDKPLLPIRGVPLAIDDFVDYDNMIMNGSNYNEFIYNENDNIWHMDYLQTNPLQKNNNQNFLENSNQNSQENNIKKHETVYDLSIYQIAVNIKDTWFELLDQILNREFNFSIFYENNGLFYIGLTLLIIGLLLYICFTLFMSH